MTQDQTPQEAPAEKAPARKASAKRASTKKASGDKAAAKRPTKKSSDRAGEKTAERPAAAKAEAPRRLGAAAIAREAAYQLHELIGQEVEGVTGVRRDGDDWLVQVDLLELRRIPATTDVLATYEVEVDDAGDLVGYRRLHRFVRGSVGEDR
jgi:hypothetical protein